MKRAFLFLLLLTSYAHAQPTVVGIHGFMSSADDLIPIKKTLECSGLCVYLWDYPSRRETISGHACQLVSILQRIATLNPEEPIHFVTHSIGTIILRAALNHPLCPQQAKIGHSVLIAPPNKGSSYARKFQKARIIRWLLGKKMGRELVTYNECDIKAFGCFPETMPILVIAGDKGFNFLIDRPNDGYVMVWETELDTPYRCKVYHATHDELLRLTEIRNLIASFLCGNEMGIYTHSTSRIGISAAPKPRA